LIPPQVKAPPEQLRLITVLRNALSYERDVTLEWQHWEEVPIPLDVQQMIGSLKHSFRAKQGRDRIWFIQDLKGYRNLFPKSAEKHASNSKFDEAVAISESLGSLSDGVKAPNAAYRLRMSHYRVSAERTGYVSTIRKFFSPH
jgi:hypothetical protein